MSALLEPPAPPAHAEGVRTIRLAGIVEQSIVDGPGLRMTLFAQGCPHRCPGCHNPDTHSASGGRDVDAASILAAFDANPLLAGVTLSGGEPFLQAEGLLPIAAGIKARGKNVWCYTGYTYEELCRLAVRREGVDALMRRIDVLVDGRFELSSRSLSLPYRGSANQRVLDLPALLRSGRGPGIFLSEKAVCR